jgi:hypothetical protein
MKKFSHIVTATVLLFSCSPQSDEKAETADAIYFGSNVCSIDGEFTRLAEAVAVKAGKVIYIGSLASAEKLRGTATEMHDLGQKTFFADFLNQAADESKQPASFSMPGNYSSLNSLPTPKTKNETP